MVDIGSHSHYSIFNIFFDKTMKDDKQKGDIYTYKEKKKI